MKKVAVIGAGMAGAGAAWFLQKAGCEVVVFEKEAHVGGRAWTYRGDDFHCNTGAGFFTNFYPLLRSLLKETGLEGKVIENPKSVTLAKGNVHYNYQLDSVLSFLRIPFLRGGDKWRVLKMTLGLTLKKKAYDMARAESLAPFDEESIAAYAIREVGENAFEHIVRSAIEPYWYFQCEEASAAMLMALQAHAAGARFFTLKGGMDGLAKAIFERMDLRLSNPVTAISMPKQGGVFLETASGSQHFDAAVLATTASAASRLAAPNKAHISPELIAFLQSQIYTPNVNGYFHVPGTALEGMGPQISPVSRENHGLAAIATHGAQVDQAKRPGEAMLGIWLTGAESQKWTQSSLETPEAEIAAHMWRTLRHFRPDLPENPAPLGKLTLREEAIPLHAPGRFRMAAKAWATQKPPLVFAGDCFATATMEGALTTGKRAAEILISAFDPTKSSHQV